MDSAPASLGGVFRKIRKGLNPNPRKRSTQTISAEDRFRRASESAFGAVTLLMALGILCIAGASYQTQTSYTGTLSGGALLALAGTILGALFGFLFGIPRSTQSGIVDKPGRGETQEAEAKHPIEYHANTNLEEISDWLTKILVGVGLTQLSKIPYAVQELSRYVSSDLSIPPSFAAGILLTYTIGGFLVGYLWTRLHLPGALWFADTSALGELEKQVSENADKISELETRLKRDAHAMYVTECQLTGDDPETPKVSQAELSESLRGASHAVRARVFYQAYSLRVRTWQDNKERMERVIPVFQALVDCDTDEKYHRNYAQLGYALKEKSEPDYEGAIRAIDAAIRIRGNIPKYRMYEANRAHCRILLRSTLGSETTTADREAICQDLTIAANSRNARIILELPEVRQWMADNGCSQA